MAADALAPYVARTSAANNASHDIDYIEYVGPSLTRGRILSTCAISMWRNDAKCKYMFMFPLKNLARKGLKILWYIESHHMPCVDSFKNTCWLQTLLSWKISVVSGARESVTKEGGPTSLPWQGPLVPTPTRWCQFWSAGKFIVFNSLWPSDV